MASLLLGVAGSALGGALLGDGLSVLGATLTGAQIGGALGALAGSQIDAALTPGRYVARTGARPGDLSLQASQEGAPIPAVYGRARLAEIDREIGKEENALRLLQTEWSYLNQPDRLDKLARQYLNLVPQKGRQFATLAQVPARASEDEKQAPPKAAPVAATEALEKAAAPAALTAAAEPPPAKPPGKPRAEAKVSTRSFDDVMKGLKKN